LLKRIIMVLIYIIRHKKTLTFLKGLLKLF
jgi:hypothetical protein